MLKPAGVGKKTTLQWVSSSQVYHDNSMIYIYIYILCMCTYIYICYVLVYVYIYILSIYIIYIYYYIYYLYYLYIYIIYIYIIYIYIIYIYYLYIYIIYIYILSIYIYIYLYIYYLYIYYLYIYVCTTFQPYWLWLKIRHLKIGLWSLSHFKGLVGVDPIFRHTQLMALSENRIPQSCIADHHFPMDGNVSWHAQLLSKKAEVYPMQKNIKPQKFL